MLSPRDLATPKTQLSVEADSQNAQSLETKNTDVNARFVKLLRAIAESKSKKFKDVFKGLAEPAQIIDMCYDANLHKGLPKHYNFPQGLTPLQLVCSGNTYIQIRKTIAQYLIKNSKKDYVPVSNTDDDPIICLTIENDDLRACVKEHLKARKKEIAMNSPAASQLANSSVESGLPLAPPLSSSPTLTPPAELAISSSSSSPAFSDEAMTPFTLASPSVASSPTSAPSLPTSPSASAFDSELAFSPPNNSTQPFAGGHSILSSPAIMPPPPAITVAPPPSPLASLPPSLTDSFLPSASSSNSSSVALPNLNQLPSCPPGCPQCSAQALTSGTYASRPDASSLIPNQIQPPPQAYQEEELTTEEAEAADVLSSLLATPTRFTRRGRPLGRQDHSRPYQSIRARMEEDHLTGERMDRALAATEADEHKRMAETLAARTSSSKRKKPPAYATSDAKSPKVRVLNPRGRNNSDVSSAAPRLLSPLSSSSLSSSSLFATPPAKGTNTPFVSRPYPPHDLFAPIPTGADSSLAEESPAKSHQTAPTPTSRYDQS
jgi:hypothetical protein